MPRTSPAIEHPTSLTELDSFLRQIPGVGSTAGLKPSVVYRGQSKDWLLDSSLLRLGGNSADLEKRIASQLRSLGLLANAPLHGDSDFTMWPHAQHYGCPTRLLDWSAQSDVAKHFCCESAEYSDQDGVIWVVNPMLIHQKTLPVGVRQSLSPAEPDQVRVPNADTVDREVKSFSELDLLSNAPTNIPCLFFEPHSIETSRRPFQQQSVLSLVAGAGESFEAVIDLIPDAFLKVFVSPALKLEMREELDSQRKTEHYYYPDLAGFGSMTRRRKRPDF